MNLGVYIGSSVQSGSECWGKYTSFYIQRCRRAQAPILGAGFKEDEGQGYFSSKKWFSAAVNTSKLRRWKRIVLMTKSFYRKNVKSVFSISVAVIPTQEYISISFL